MDEARPQEAAFDQLVVIGSSAGGIDALSRLVATLPHNFPAPIVIAQHLDPAHDSRLEEILARCSVLPVRTVAVQEDLTPGVIFVVPANRYVAVTDHVVSVRETGVGRSKPSIDLLLSSAAAVFGERLIAVILTGSGSDGTVGARAVKAAGGTVVIQDPATAAYPSMPRSLAPTTVDLIADLERIGPLLYDLLKGTATLPRATDTAAALLEDAALIAVLARVRARQGLDFAQYKTTTIQRRLQRRIAATGVGTLTAYGTYLDDHPEEYRRLVSSFLINVTEFFRDVALFDELRDHVLPVLIAQARAGNNTLRLWSAGCATGEEAYSLAILVTEMLGSDLQRIDVRLFATDLDAEAIAFARYGLYPASALESLPDDLRARYFTPVDGGFEVVKSVRNLAVFGEHDLGQRPPFPRIDLALCRNVLIYFTPELQLRALQLFAFALRVGGYLALGNAETPRVLAEYFEAAHPRLKIYRRSGVRAPVPPIWRTEVIGQPSQRMHSVLTALPGVEAASTRADRAGTRPVTIDLLAELPWGVVIVDRRYDIQSINPVAQRFLGIYRDAVGDDIVHLAQGIASLRTAIDATFQSAAPVRVEETLAVTLATGEDCVLQVTCRPVAPQTGAVEAVMILLSDVTEAEQATARHRADLEHLTKQVQRMAAANRDLLTANDLLARAAVGLQHDTETTQADIAEAQAHMEEVITLNEELQATNEEMETLNEELQASNEEMEKANIALEARRLELHELAITLEAERAQLAVILADIGDAVLVVGPTGAIVRTNAAYARLAGTATAALAPEDEHGQRLPAAVTPQARASRGETFSMEFTVMSADGTRRWYEAHGEPLHDHGVEVGVVVIRDVTPFHEQRRLQDEFLALASHELRTPLTSIGGYLDLLVRRLATTATDERIVRYATQAHSQMHRLDLLVSDLTDVTRLQTGKLTFKLASVEIGALVQRAVEIARTLPPGHTIYYEEETEQVYVRGDAGRLEQVLLNLLTNALTHAPTATGIVVRWQRVGAQVAVVVQDYGDGIAAEQLPHIFSRFYQVVQPNKPSHRGLGLGLYISNQIVTAHGGRIDVASVVGEGTTFTVWLPLAEPGAGLSDRLEPDEPSTGHAAS